MSALATLAALGGPPMQKCVCGRVVSQTPKGTLYQHKTPEGRWHRGCPVSS